MRSTHPLATARTLLAAALSAALLAGCSSADDTTAKTPQKVASPAQKIVAPLLDLDVVDVESVALPETPQGVDRSAWISNARSVRAIAVASLGESSWDTAAGPETIRRVAGSAPDDVGRAMIDATAKAEPATALDWAPTFAGDTQPATARVVDARWAHQTITTNGPSRTLAVLQVTTLYTVDAGRPLVVQRQIALGSQRPTPDLGTFTWVMGTETGGQDTCRYYTDAVVTPADSPDLQQLQSLVDQVVDQTEVVIPEEGTDIAEERTKACADV